MSISDLNIYKVTHRFCASETSHTYIYEFDSMLRGIRERLRLPFSIGNPGYISKWPRYIVSSRSYTSIFPDEKSVKAARQWLETFSVESIPRSKCIISFSRSSGPGGQNVNKYGEQWVYRKS